MKNYIKKYLFKNCINPIFTSDKLIYFKKTDDLNYLHYSDFNFSNVKTLNNDKSNNYGFYTNYCFCSQNPLKSINILNIDKFEKTQLRGSYFLFSRDNNYVYFTNESENSCNRLNPYTKEITKLFKIQEKDFLNYSKFIVTGLGIGCSKPNEIRLLDIERGNLLWQYKVEDYFNAACKILEGRILVVEDRIIFFAHTENWDSYATFILDAKTGKVLFTTNQMGLKLYEYNKHIYQIQEKRIKILNPITTEIQTIELSEELAKRRLILEDKVACFYNNKLYTLAREENNDIYSIWLIINLETEEIEYQYEMLFDPNKKVTDENKMFITDIQANDKMIAVLGGNNLHIFEKEESVS